MECNKVWDLETPGKKKVWQKAVEKLNATIWWRSKRIAVRNTEICTKVSCEFAEGNNKTKGRNHRSAEKTEEENDGTTTRTNNIENKNYGNVKTIREGDP